jgi:hypothetical protein
MGMAMPDDHRANDSQGLFRRFMRMMHHEITTVPVTFTASVIVIIPVLYAAVEFAISPPSLALPVPNLPSVTTPIPGLNILLKGCTFLVLQWAVSTLFARSIQFVSRRIGDASLMLTFLAALVYGWLSTFISFILWVISAPHVDGAIMVLFATFFVSFFILIYSTPEEVADEVNYSVFVVLFGLVALFIFSIVFGFQATDYFRKPI